MALEGNSQHLTFLYRSKHQCKSQVTYRVTVIIYLFIFSLRCQPCHMTVGFDSVAYKYMYNQEARKSWKLHRSRLVSDEIKVVAYGVVIIFILFKLKPFFLLNAFQIFKQWVERHEKNNEWQWIALKCPPLELKWFWKSNQEKFIWITKIDIILSIFVFSRYYCMVELAEFAVDVWLQVCDRILWMWLFHGGFWLFLFCGQINSTYINLLASISLWHL